MKKTLVINASISIGTLLLCFVLAEAAVRFVGTYDEDGNFIIRETALKPYRLPVVTMQQKVDIYLQLMATQPATLTTMHDDLLGWTLRPNSGSEDGYYNHNSAGIRSAPTEYSLTPPEGVLRIALFGDSFTYGDEVPFENSWGYYLEKKLKEAGVAAEVINFGVPGYGMDQAYLRWHYLGHQYQPHLVIFGLQMENTLRNVNLIRAVASPGTGVPFSKPRFTINGDNLELLNSPAIPPQKVPVVMKNIEDWELVKYEYAYNPEDYQKHIWLKSKLIALALEAGTSFEDSQGKTRQLYFDEKTWDLTNEPAQLVLKIIQVFKEEVEAQGAEFVIVRLPIYKDISTLLDGAEFQYAPLLEKIEQDNIIIYPERQRLKQVFELNLASIDDLFTRESGGHYSALSNELVADVIAEYILAQQLDRQTAVEAK